MSSNGNDQKFKDVSFSIPQETAGQRMLRLEDMSASLLNMINEVKASVSLTDDPHMKEQLHTVISSLNTVKDKVEQAIQ